MGGPEGITGLSSRPSAHCARCPARGAPTSAASRAAPASRTAATVASPASDSAAAAFPPTPGSVRMGRGATKSLACVGGSTV